MWYEFGFVFPSQLMLHAKALTTAEALIFVLAPNAKFERLARPFVAEEYAGRAASLDLVKRRASQILPELLLLGELPPRAAIDDAWDQDASREVFVELGDRIQNLVQRSLEGGEFWQTLFAPHIRAVLVTTWLADSVDEILDQLWSRYYEIEPTIAPQPTFGALFTTHVAAGILALHENLIGRGISAEESYRLIYQIGWRFYTQMGEPSLLIASAFTLDAAKRLKIATDIFRLFPFGSPSYQWSDVPARGNVVAFDCLKCPALGSKRTKLIPIFSGVLTPFFMHDKIPCSERFEGKARRNQARHSRPRAEDQVGSRRSGNDQ